MAFRITVTITLVLAVAADSCTVSPDNATPPPATVPVIVVPASGVRIWDCAAGKPINATQINGRANVTTNAGGWTGGFYYPDDVARWVLKNGSAPAFEFDLDAHPGLKPNEGRLADSRWTVTFMDNNYPPVFKGKNVYWVRTDNVGGATPTTCANATATTIEVPFSSTFTMYACDGAGPASGAVSAAFGVAAAAVMAIAALF